MNLYIPVQTKNQQRKQPLNRQQQQAMPKKTSIHFLYENFCGRFFFNEEPYSLWTCCSNPYSDSSIVTIALNDPDIIENPEKYQYVSTIPRCKLYRGLILQGYLISPKFLRSLDSFTIRQDDLFICSYPRSGTTWTEEIVSAIASKMDTKFMSKPVHDRVVHLEVGRTFGQNHYLKSLKSPRILSTHLPFSHCPQELKSLKCKVIYILRNAKDQAVSYYHFHHTAMYLGSKKWPFDQFIQLYLQGIMCYGSWFDHVSGWLEAAMRHPKQILVISYEELQVNLPLMIKLIASFLETQLTDEVVDSIVKHCQFNSMKNNPAVNREETPLSDLFKATKFMRKGQIGDWKNNFNQMQANMIDEKVESELGRFKLNLPSNYAEALLMFKMNQLRVFELSVLNGRTSDQSDLGTIQQVITSQPGHSIVPLTILEREESDKLKEEEEEEKVTNECATFEEVDLTLQMDEMKEMGENDSIEKELVKGYRKRELKPNLSQITEESICVYETTKSQFVSSNLESSEIDEVNNCYKYIKRENEIESLSQGELNHEEFTPSDTITPSVTTSELKSEIQVKEEQYEHIVKDSIVNYTVKCDEMKSDSPSATLETSNSNECESLNIEEKSAIASVSLATLIDRSSSSKEKEANDSLVFISSPRVLIQGTIIEQEKGEGKGNEKVELQLVREIEEEKYHSDTVVQSQSQQLELSVINNTPRSESLVTQNRVTSSPTTAGLPIPGDQARRNQGTSILTYNLDTFK